MTMSARRRYLPEPRHAFCGAGVLLLFAAFTFQGASSAQAELKLCNNTSSRIGVAIGYKDAKEGWTSEGWWNVDSQSCDILIQDRLRARYYYIYALDYDRGGEWGGQILMCTADNEFTVRGVENCDGRGYKRTGFFEVDTQEQADWTVKLTEETDAAPSASAGQPSQ